MEKQKIGVNKKMKEHLNKENVAIVLIAIIVSYIGAVIICTSLATILLCAFDPAYLQWNADTLPTSVWLHVVWDVATAWWIPIAMVIVLLAIIVVLTWSDAEELF